MQAEQIAIHPGRPDVPFETVGNIKVKKGAQPTPFNARPTEDDVNVRLRQKAAQMGADAVIDVKYKKGVIPSSWRGMTATGTAVKLG